MSFSIETFVRRCPKSGRIAGIRRNALLPRVLLPLLGLLASAWFLLRVIPKPSRAAYPCQRIAAGMGAGFLAHLVTLVAALARAGARTKWRASSSIGFTIPQKTAAAH